MKKKFEFLTKTKNMLIIFSTACVVFIVLGVIATNIFDPFRNFVATIVSPMQKGMNYIGLWTSEKIENMKEIEELQAKNEQLQKELDALKAENNNLKQQTYKIEEYEKLFQLSSSIDYPTIGASIIGKGADNWYSTFILDKGSKDGIEVDMNVIAQTGLVGIVTGVTENTCTVTSIISDDCKVSGMLMDSGDVCTIGGSLKLMEKGLISLYYLEKDVVIRDGDKIVTSNISSKYLKGILIGYAKDVRLDANNLTQSGYIVPAVDFKHLRDVLIILEKKQQ